MPKRMLTRREMLRMLGLSSVGVALAACATPATPEVVKETVQVEKVVTATPPPEGPVTIEFWNPYGDLEGQVMDKLVKQWNDKNPNIQVKSTYTPNVTSAGDNPKFLAAALSGNPPDVFIHDGSSFSTSTNLGAFTPIDDFIQAKGIKPDAFFKWAWNKVQWGGKTYGLPLDTDARALYWNKDLLAKAGIQAPPKTIDELDRMTQQLTVKDGDRINSMGFIPWIGNWFLIAWGWDWGLNVFDAGTNKIHLNGQEMIDALTWEVGYAQKYGVQSIQNFQQGFGSGAEDPFRSSKVAMILTGNWEINSIKQYAPNLQYDIAPPPYPAGKSAMTWSGGFVSGLPRGGKHLPQAWDFLYWLCAGEAAGQYAIQTEHMPTFVEAANQMAKTNPRQKVFIDLLPVSFIEPVIPEWTMAWDAHLAAEQQALFGQKSPKEALDAANQKVQDAIDVRLAG